MELKYRDVHKLLELEIRLKQNPEGVDRTAYNLLLHRLSQNWDLNQVIGLVNEIENRYKREMTQKAEEAQEALREIQCKLEVIAEEITKYFPTKA